MNKNLVQASVTLAQIFLDKLQVPYTYKEDIGEYTIKFLCKWLGTQEDLDDALNDFRQHNEDCRYECYCCWQCHDIEDFKMDEPNIKDEYVKNIKDLLLTFTKYKGENEDINKIFSN